MSEDIYDADIKFIQKCFPNPLKLGLGIEPDWSKIRITVEGTRSMTLFRDAHQISEQLEWWYNREYNKQLQSVVDCTANIGGNVISFAIHHLRVVAYEIKPFTANILRGNLEAYNVHRIVDVICDDFTKHLDNIAQSDVVFIDPPWYINDQLNVSLQLLGSKYTVWHCIEILRAFRPDIVVAVKLSSNIPKPITPRYHISLTRYNIYIF